MDIFIAIAHYFVGTLSLLYDRFWGKWVPNKKLGRLPNMEGYTAVVTGGGRGIGVDIVRELVKTGMTVIVGVRAPEKTIELQESLRKYPGKAHFEKLDLGSLDSVEKFANTVLQISDNINILINNAGLYIMPYELTVDGYEARFGTNYLGHFKLTHLLTEALERGAQAKNNFSRVVNLSSCAHYCAKMYWDDFNMTGHTDSTTIYGQSKLAQHLSSHYLNKYFVKNSMPIRSNCVHPGLAVSGMTAHYGIIADLFYKTSYEGAVVVLYAALEPDLEGKGGLYLSNCEPGAESSYAKDERNQKRLFEWTMKELKINTFGKTSSKS